MTAPAAGADDKRFVPQEVLRQLNRQFNGFEVPAGQFDPSAASPDQLTKFGLPPRPDPATHPLLFQAWQRGFGKPMDLQPFVFNEAQAAVAKFRPLVRALDITAVAGTSTETSANWSGGYITANQNRRFLQIWGAWTIPQNLQMPKPELQGPPAVPYVCSNWIGLDGQRLYFDSALPQIGTASTLQPDGTTTAQAWTQWWARATTNTAPMPLGLAVAPGNEVLCVLTALDPRTVIFVMVNLSAQPVPTGMAYLATAPEVQVPDGTLVQPNIAGATAEWVLERPRVVGQPTPCNFPNYGQSKFTLCLAAEGDAVDLAALPGALEQHLRGTRLLRMFDVLLNPARSEFISMPKRLGDTSLSVSYGGF